MKRISLVALMVIIAICAGLLVRELGLIHRSDQTPGSSEGPQVGLEPPRYYEPGMPPGPPDQAGDALQGQQTTPASVEKVLQQWTYPASSDASTDPFLAGMSPRKTGRSSDKYTRFLAAHVAPADVWRFYASLAKSGPDSGPPGSPGYESVSVPSSNMMAMSMTSSVAGMEVGNFSKLTPLCLVHATLIYQKGTDETRIIVQVVPTKRAIPPRPPAQPVAAHPSLNRQRPLAKSRPT